jgi:hypothetical protein
VARIGEAGKHKRIFMGNLFKYDHLEEDESVILKWT